MRNILTPEERARLLKLHRSTPTKYEADRLKVLLLYDDGWTFQKIAEALLLDSHTVSNYLKSFKETGKTTKDSGGSECRLSERDIEELKKHLDEVLHHSSQSIVGYIQKSFGVEYTQSGVLALLKRIGYSFKKAKGIPSKTDSEKQRQFIEEYEELKRTVPEDEPILFGDGVHPTMATKLSFGWIRRGQEYLISTTASRTRMNILGAINLETMQICYQEYETINSAAMCQFFEKVRQDNHQARKIHLILDQGSYKKSSKTLEAAERFNITIHFLPPYSPNLNPIEHLWKVMNKTTRDNVFFETAKQFREAIHGFFQDFWVKNSENYIDTIGDAFTPV